MISNKLKNIVDSEILFKFEVQDLASAREFLIKNNNQFIELINAPGTMRYYGILVLNYIFISLQKEFPNIKKISYDFENDHAAYDTAKKLKII